MTFVLKDFEELKKQFKDATTVILKHYSKEKIADLAEPRKNELQFLTAVLAELETRSAIYKTKANLKPFVNIFYGAMLVIAKDIENNLGRMEKKENSLLYTSLMECMGITEKVKPDAHQYMEFFKGLNAFLPLIFVEQNSRKGLNSKHALDIVPLQNLATLVTTSYMLDKDANNTAIAELKVEGETLAEARSYTVSKDVSAPVIAQFKWEDLKKSLHDLLLEERAIKKVSHINKLDEKRAAQLIFLTSVEASLTDIKSGLKEAEKIAILAGAMYIVRGQIAQEYSKNPLSTDDINTVIHKGLTDILKAKEECHEDVEVLVTAANQYLHYMTVEPAGTPKDKDSIRVNNLFSKIAGFNLVKTFNLIQSMIITCRVEALRSCVEKASKEASKTAEAAPSSSYFALGLGKFFFRSATAPKEKDEDDTLEANATAASSASNAANPAKV